MNKHLLKQTIIYLNEFSLDDDHDLVSQTVREIKRQDPSMSEGDVIKVIHLLQKIHALEAVIQIEKCEKMMREKKKCLRRCRFLKN